MNPVVHFEMPAEDRERVKKFYESSFGWEMTQLGPEMGDYLLAATSPLDENKIHIKKGAINGGFYQKAKPGTIPHIVISVDNLKKKGDVVKSPGGRIKGNPLNTRGIGDFDLSS